jgi:hypothetical protein
MRRERKPPVRAWRLHQPLEGRSGIFAFNAASPAGVMRYLPPPLTICCSIQPFLTKIAIVALPAG